MSKDKEVLFLFDISKEVKQFYETPVIYFTKKDYADPIFNTLCTLRKVLDSENKKDIIDIIVDFHLQWLHTVNEMDNFKKLAHELPREEVYQAISYTIDALAARLKYYQRYMEKYRPNLSNKDQFNLIADLEIVEDMHLETTQVLLKKLKCFRNFASNREFTLKVLQEIGELMHWFDKIYDSLSTLISKYVNFHAPHLCSDLTKTLNQIVEEFHTSQSPSALKLIEEMKEKGKELSSMIRCTTGHSLEISKVIEKIGILEDRIERLNLEPTSAAVMALQRKKEYLERRLSSLEKLKTTIQSLHKKSIEDMSDEDSKKSGEENFICSCEDFFTLRIFNHELPLEEREKLVTKLCSLWDLAVFGERGQKSIISILSAADMKEEYTDELGKFYIDEYSRKIYRLPDDETLYQPNEHSELVPLSDDLDHIYFFDECGRYFIDQHTRQRVYKAHATASEYMMDSSGVLLKVKEVRDDITYYYDNFGRYYINSQGKHIYKDSDHLSEYENDGLGNLVRMRSQTDIFELCPDDELVTEDFKYLKKVIGSALRYCIARCILVQPTDPIKYLAAALVRYRENIEIREKRATEQYELNMQRELIAKEERDAAERAARELIHGESEASYDSDLAGYTTMGKDDATTSSFKT